MAKLTKPRRTNSRLENLRQRRARIDRLIRDELEKERRLQEIVDRSVESVVQDVKKILRRYPVMRGAGRALSEGEG